MDYLKDKQYYVDRYDLQTIKDCLEVIDVHTKVYVKSVEDKKTKDIPKGERAKTMNWLTNQQLYVIKADRYGNKEKTIQGWINHDQTKQEKYDNTPIPQGVYCHKCGMLTKHRIKQLDILENPCRMMFLFECPSCHQRKWIDDDGSERKSSPQLCPKCKAEVDVTTVKESKDKIVWKQECKLCGYSEITTDNLEKNRQEWRQQEEKDKKLLSYYRQEFCSEKVGKEAFDYIEALKVAYVVYKRELQKYESAVYQNIVSLKKLAIGDLEKLLQNRLEKNNFVKLTFQSPEFSQYVIVPFSVQDGNLSRKQEDSIVLLKKCLNDLLSGTNWRLMSDGLSYRLGYISGRLKGYEREEDLLKLVDQPKILKPKDEIDPEKLNQYAYHNVVELARLSAEFKGIENMRKRRLKNEPEGFFLEADKGPY